MKCTRIILIIIITFVNSFANEVKLDKVSLQLQWKEQFKSAGFYAAKEKGFYKDVGLDITLIEPNETTDIVNNIVTKKATYGLSSSSIIAEYINGQPIVLISNYFKQSPLSLITQKKITTLSQLKGSEIQGLSNNIDYLSLYTMLNKFDIKENDIEISPRFSLEAFKNKEVDAIVSHSANESYLLTNMEIDHNSFNPTFYGINYFDANLFTTKEEVKNHPKRVQSFKEASNKGWAYALEHKEEIIELILEKYNFENKSVESLHFEAKEVERLMLSHLEEIGNIDVTILENIAKNYVELGFAKKDSMHLIKNFIFYNQPNKKFFSKEEREYLDEKSSLTICVDPNWMPVEAVENGNHIGVASDYWKIFEEKLDVDISIFQTKSWSGSLKAMEEEKCDVLSLSSPTSTRSELISFTDSFLELSFVIVTKIDKENVLDFSLLDGTSIAIVKGYAMVDAMAKKYPKINIVEVNSIEDGLKKVADNEVFGFADSAVAIDYAYKNGFYDDFKVSAHFDEKLHLGLGIAKENKILYNIFQKIISNIEYNQKREILKKWFSSKYEARFDYVLFFQLSFFILVILLVGLYRNHSVKELNKELHMRVKEELEKSSKKDKMIFHQSKLVAMGEMMENIAHQWRQPLSQVNSCVLLIDDILDEKKITNLAIEEKLQEIESLTKYMSNTIDDFKNFFDQNKVKKNIIIEDVIVQSLKILKGKFDENNVSIITDQRTAHACFTHPNELQQVFLAILNNAVDILVINAIDKPEVKVEVNRDKKNIYIKISDNAGGIQEDKLEKIFEPYYTTKYNAQGTGLGLYISKVIVEDSLSGELKVENEFRGACFKIRLDLESSTLSRKFK